MGKRNGAPRVSRSPFRLRSVHNTFGQQPSPGPTVSQGLDRNEAAALKYAQRRAASRGRGGRNQGWWRADLVADQMGVGMDADAPRETRYEQELHRGLGIWGNIAITVSAVTPASSV